MIKSELWCWCSGNLQCIGQWDVQNQIFRLSESLDPWGNHKETNGCWKPIIEQLCSTLCVATLRSVLSDRASWRNLSSLCVKSCFRFAAIIRSRRKGRLKSRWWNRYIYQHLDRDTTTTITPTATIIKQHLPQSSGPAQLHQQSRPPPSPPTPWITILSCPPPPPQPLRTHPPPPPVCQR